MTVRMVLALVALAVCCGVSHAEERWVNFAEDADLRYYLDQKSVTSLPDNVYMFWVKSVAKDRDYYRKEYNIKDLAYILTNYELDCAVSSYRVRGTIMYDKNRKEINKIIPAGGEPVFEPVPPESMLELAQNDICSKAGTAKQESEEPSSTAPTPASPAAQPATEPPSIQ